MITPRSEERKALVETLESEDYETADQLAGAIIKQVFEMLQRRTLHVAVARQEGVLPTTLFGPFATQADAVRAVGKSWFSAGGGEAQVLEVHSADELKPADPSRDTDKCQTCRHPHGAHQHTKFRGMCAVGAKTVKTRKCDCREFS